MTRLTENRCLCVEVFFLCNVNVITEKRGGKRAINKGFHGEPSLERVRHLSQLPAATLNLFVQVV